jgi:hypothetical protein
MSEVLQIVQATLIGELTIIPVASAGGARVAQGGAGVVRAGFQVPDAGGNTQAPQNVPPPPTPGAETLQEPFDTGCPAPCRDRPE